MNTKISISEQDIFNYIFYPDILSTDKAQYLNSHQNEFSEQIEFCKILKQQSEGKEVVEVGSQNVFVLYPVVVSTKNSGKILTLAAASSELDKKIETKTFIDHDSQFLVRMVSTDEEKTLYVFAKEKDFNNAKLTIMPSNKTFQITPLESSITIDKSEEIEKISIEKIN